MGNSQCHLKGVRVRQALTGTGAACFPGLTGASVAGRILLMTPNRAPRAKRCLPGWLQWVGSAGQLCVLPPALSLPTARAVGWFGAGCFGSWEWLSRVCVWGGRDGHMSELGGQWMLEVRQWVTRQPSQCLRSYAVIFLNAGH